MTWTYGGAPSTGTRDAIRFLIGDTDTSDQLVTDEEITWATGTYSNQYMAAAEICDAIAAKYSRLADTDNEGLSVKASQRAEAYAKRSKELRRKALRAVSIWVGGRSESERETAEDDTNNRQPYFSVGMNDFDYPSSQST